MAIEFGKDTAFETAKLELRALRRKASGIASALEQAQKTVGALDGLEATMETMSAEHKRTVASLLAQLDRQRAATAEAAAESIKAGPKVKQLQARVHELEQDAAELEKLRDLMSGGKRR